MTDYQYHDADGVVKYQVHRNAQKRFTMTGDTNVRVPFALPALLAAADAGGTAFIVEGEKDALNLQRALGDAAVVTTSAGGASWKWPREWCEHFRGLQAVHVIADNDDPGRTAAVQRALTLRDVAPTVTVLAALPGVAEHGDVSDWLQNGGDVQQLWRLVQGAPEARALAPASNVPVVDVQMSTVRVEPVRWLWPGWLAYGKVALLEGDPSLGKSTLALTLAARVTTGTAFPDETPGQRREPADVVLLSAEDAPADTLKPRLLEAGADCERVWLLRGTYNATDHSEQFLHFPEDLATLEAYVQRKRATFVVVDVLAAYMGNQRSGNSNSDADIRTMLSPLTRLAERTGASVFAIRHWNKSGSQDLMYRGGGSIAIAGAARHIYAVVAHPEQEGLNVLLCVKNNLAPKAEPFSYSITEGNEYATARLKWRGPIDITVQELMRRRHAETATDDEDERERAKAWVFTSLLDGWMFANSIIEAGQQEGFSRATLQRAATDLGVQKRREQQPDGSMRSVWRLPE